MVNTRVLVDKEANIKTCASVLKNVIKIGFEER